MYLSCLAVVCHHLTDYKNTENVIVALGRLYIEFLATLKQLKRE